MGSLAEMERELTLEGTRAGLEIARQLGCKGGRKRIVAVRGYIDLHTMITQLAVRSKKKIEEVTVAVTT